MGGIMIYLLLGLAHIGADQTCIPDLAHRWAYNEIKGDYTQDSVTLGGQSLKLPQSINFFVDEPTSVPCPPSGCLPGQKCKNGVCSSWNPEGTSAMQFNGVSMLPFLAYQRPSAVTVSLWFKASPENVQAQALWSFYSRDTTISLRIQGDLTSNPESSYAGKLQLYTSDNPFMTKTTARSYCDDEWHFVAVTIGQTGAAVYVYTEEELSDPELTLSAKVEYKFETPLSSTRVFQIGGFDVDVLQDYFYFNGEMDDLRMYSTVVAGGRILDIGRQQDFPCTMTKFGLGTHEFRLASKEVGTFVLDVSDEVCGSETNSVCSNKRYGVAVESCQNTLIGLNFNSDGKTDNLATAVSNFTAFCAATSTGTATSTASRLCGSVNTNTLVVGATAPINSNVLNQIILVANDNPNNEDSQFTLRVTVADDTNYNPGKLSIASVKADGVQCNAEQTSLSASWPVPLLNNAAACSDCNYQIWLVPSNQATGVNLKSECGLRSAGAVPYGPFCALNGLVDFRLGNEVPTDAYKVVIWGKSTLARTEGVVAVLDGCLLTNVANGTVPLDTYTCPCTNKLQCPYNGFCNDNRCSNQRQISNTTFNATTVTVGVSMKLDYDYSSMTGVEQDGFTEDLMVNVAEAIQTNRSRLQYARTDPGSIISSFNILPATDSVPTAAPTPCCTEPIARCEACEADLTIPEYCDFPAKRDVSGCSDLKLNQQSCDPSLGIECAYNLYCAKQKFSEQKFCIPKRNRPPTPSPTAVVLDMRNAVELTHVLQGQVEDTNSTLHRLQPGIDSNFWRSTLPDSMTTSQAPEESPSPASTDDDTALIIGVTIGSIVVISAIVGVIICFVKRCCCFAAKEEAPAKKLPASPRPASNQNNNSKPMSSARPKTRNRNNSGARGSAKLANNKTASNASKPAKTAAATKPATTAKPAQVSKSPTYETSPPLSKPAAAAVDLPTITNEADDSGVESGPTLKEEVYVRTSFPWEGEDDDEDLTFEAGVEILVLKRQVRQGPNWLKGQIGKKVGLVPKTYVGEEYRK